MTQKNAPRDAHSREEEICRKRPRSARECAKAHSFLSEKIKLLFIEGIRIKPLPSARSVQPCALPAGG